MYEEIIEQLRKKIHQMDVIYTDGCSEDVVLLWKIIGIYDALDTVRDIQVAEENINLKIGSKILDTIERGTSLLEEGTPVEEKDSEWKVWDWGYVMDTNESDYIHEYKATDVRVGYIVKILDCWDVIIDVWGDTEQQYYNRAVFRTPQECMNHFDNKFTKDN